MDKALEIIKDKINEKQAHLAKAMGEGAAKDFAEYRAICGERSEEHTSELQSH